jgi:hypothetical protein
MFTSSLQPIDVVTLPEYAGIRVMMMPFHTHDVRGSLPPDLARWAPVVERMATLSPDGIGYLTIDEAIVRAGETHRRPGLHVDGVGPDGSAGGWGGGGYAHSGMTMVSSHVGCRAYGQAFHGKPAGDGDCAHLASELDAKRAVDLRPGIIYLCSPMTVHEALPMTADTRRQFCRVSFPSSAPWYEGYTENPLGIRPAGPVHPRRVEQMGYRP